MSIPEGQDEDKEAYLGARGGWGSEEDGAGANQGASGSGHFMKDWKFWALVLLTGTLCLGAGLIAGREEGGKKDASLWIEQLPADEISGGMGSSTSAAQGAVQPQQPSAPSADTPVNTSQPAGAAAAGTPPSSAKGAYVASKSGTKYYLPTCGSANRIKDENKVWFATKAAAEAAGYEPSSTCKGI